MGLNSAQENKIRKIVERKLTEKANEFQKREDMNKPFYAALFSKELIYKASLLQSVYTWFGSKWEEFAKIIAEGNYDNVVRRAVIEGEITDSESSVIDNILDDLDQGKSNPDISEEKEMILNVEERRDSRNASQQVDLVLEDGEKHYFEIKSVKPNKNEVKAAKRDLLKLIAMKGDVRVYLAMPYNPYFSGNHRRWTVTKFFEEGEDLLVGKEFWNFLGGDNTYSDLLELFEEVGNDIESILG